MQTDKYSVKYGAFIKKYKNTPKIARVIIEWKDNRQQHDYLISLDDYWADDTPYQYRNTEMGVLSEEDIFYHAGNIQYCIYNRLLINILQVISQKYGRNL